MTSPPIKTVIPPLTAICTRPGSRVNTFSDTLAPDSISQVCSQSLPASPCTVMMTVASSGFCEADRSQTPALILSEVQLLSLMLMESSRKAMAYGNGCPATLYVPPQHGPHCATGIVNVGGSVGGLEGGVESCGVSDVVGSEGGVAGGELVAELPLTTIVIAPCASAIVAAPTVAAAPTSAPAMAVTNGCLAKRAAGPPGDRLTSFVPLRLMIPRPMARDPQAVVGATVKHWRCRSQMKDRRRRGAHPAVLRRRRSRDDPRTCRRPAPSTATSPAG